MQPPSTHTGASVVVRWLLNLIVINNYIFITHGFKTQTKRHSTTLRHVFCFDVGEFWDTSLQCCRCSLRQIKQGFFTRVMARSSSLLPLLSASCCQRPISYAVSKKRWGKIIAVLTKKHLMLAVDNSLFKGTEASLCWPDRVPGVICCFLGAKIRDTA